MIAAVQDRVVGKARAVLELVRHQLHHHTLGFVLVVARGVNSYRIADAVIAPQFFLEHLGVVVDQVVRDLEDALRGTVVLLQLDDAQLGIVIAQVVQVLDACAAHA